MLYKAKVAGCSQILTNTQRKASTMYNFLISNLVVSKETARLKMVNEYIEENEIWQKLKPKLMSICRVFHVL
jgi:hypothetical protein